MNAIYIERPINGADAENCCPKQQFSGKRNFFFIYIYNIARSSATTAEKSWTD